MIYNIDFEVVGLIICIVLLGVLHINYDISSKNNFYFRLLILSLMMTLFFDIASAVSSSFPENIPLFVHYLLNTVYFAFATLTILAGLKYVVASCGYEMGKVSKITIYGLLAAYAVFLFINPLTRLLFYFEEGTNAYTHGAAYLLNYAVPIVIMIYMLVILIKGRKKFTPKKAFSNYVFIFCTILCSVLQMTLFPQVLLTSFGGSISAVLMLFALETPDFVELEYLKSNLEAEVEKKTEQIENMSIQTIAALAQTIDAKDEYTRGHSSRVAKYSRLLATSIGYDEKESFDLYKAALLHDIGKIGIPDEILQKKSKLTDEEYEVIKKHTSIGSEILQSINISNAEYIARHHHERFDGEGYPDGLSGDKLTLDARIVAIADSYDAMSSDRVYRKALPRETIVSELIKNRGMQFDGELVDRFVELIESGEVDKVIG